MRDGLQGGGMRNDDFWRTWRPQATHPFPRNSTPGKYNPSYFCVLICLLGDLGTHHLRKLQVVKLPSIQRSDRNRIKRPLLDEGLQEGEFH